MRESKASRRSRRSAETPGSILVASILVINAADSCHAAPRPVQTADSALKRSSSGAAAFADVDCGIPKFLQQKAAIEATGRHRRLQLLPSEWGEGRAKRMPTPTIARRSYSIATASGKSIIVPSGFASTIASSWDPGSRSIWFQRKAVIICAIFLAIFIVLIIGAAVFLRDKREDDAEEEVDVSDEAALKRMREEREMRKGGRNEKKRRRKRTKKSAADGDDEGSREDLGATTGFKWVKIPTRRLKKRSTKSSSQKSRSSHSGPDGNASNVPSPRVSMTSQSRDGASNESAQASEGAEVVPTHADGSSHNAVESPSVTGEAADLRAPLSAADVTAAEEAERRQQGLLTDEGVDAFPPAYIPSHRRTPTGDRLQLHPSSDRPLGGGLPASRGQGDEKDPASFEERAAEPLPSSSSLPSGSGGMAATVPSSEEDDYSAHVATDDKTMLGRLRSAASQPSAPSPYVQAPAPSYHDSASASAASTTGSSPSTSLPASAPTLHASAPPDLDVTEEEWEEIDAVQAQSKGKGASSHLDLLPAPPAPAPSTTFSHFDMPYANPLPSAPSPPQSPTGNAAAKAQEAAEEHRQVLALMESRPEEMNHLPQYDGQHQPSASSALEAEEGEEEEARMTGAALPSAPSLDEE